MVFCIEMIWEDLTDWGPKWVREPEIWGRAFGRGTQSLGPEAGVCPVWLGNSKEARVSGAE